MGLSPERKQNIRNRVEPILRELNAELKLLEILLDSTRQNLAFVVQSGEQPRILRVDYLHYVSMSEAELRDSLRQQWEATEVRESRPAES